MCLTALSNNEGRLTDWRCACSKIDELMLKVVNRILEDDFHTRHTCDVDSSAG